jgi:hypothetical protein
MESWPPPPGSKPPLGGWLPGLSFSDTQAAVLNALADEIIPPGNGFPAPSRVDIVGFFARYVTPACHEPKWYPFFGEADFRARLDALAAGVLAADSAGRVEVLRGLEADDAAFFERLRDIVYFGYYSRPEVVRAINDNLAGGKGYRSTPQPFGYLDTMAGWDEALLARVHGSYRHTEDVVALDLPADLPAGRTTR